MRQKAIAGMLFSLPALAAATAYGGENPAVPLQRDDIVKMSPAKAAAILRSDARNYDGWCAVVTYAPTALFADETVKSSLIGLVERINKINEDWRHAYDRGENPAGLKSQIGEGFGECQGELATRAVPVLKGDKRALRALVEGHRDAALDFGDEAGRLAIQERADPSSSLALRAEMIDLLGRLKEKGTLSPSLQEQAEKTVFDASSDENDGIKRIAIRNLRHFSKAKALKRLKEISATDSRSFIRKSDQEQVFPIREEAKKELDRLLKTK
ncbi:MAG: hypothetical protein HYV14_01655 [Elusimicrobia bacterium]|nr:hypothetical protein [Elusimicrobiota bacterium]